MTDQLIHSPADLRPGDIMLGPIGGAVGLGVGLGHLALGKAFRLGRRSVRHAGLVTGVDTDGVRMVEAMPSGAREVLAVMPERWTGRHAYVRLPGDYPGQAENAASIARLMVEAGVSYSFASYAYLAAWAWGVKTPRIERWINRRRPAVDVKLGSPMGDTYWTQVALPVEAICSVLVDQAWSLAGKKVMEDVACQAVTPGALATQLLTTPGATWALPREDPRLPAKSWVV